MGACVGVVCMNVMIKLLSLLINFVAGLIQFITHFLPVNVTVVCQPTHTLVKCLWSWEQCALLAATIHAFGYRQMTGSVCLHVCMGGYLLTTTLELCHSYCRQHRQCDNKGSIDTLIFSGFFILQLSLSTDLWVTFYVVCVVNCNGCTGLPCTKGSLSNRITLKPTFIHTLD